MKTIIDKIRPIFPKKGWYLFLACAILFSSCSTYTTPWESYPEEWKKIILDNHRAFKPLAFSMKIEEIINKDVNGKTYPDWFVGYDMDESLVLPDSILNKCSIYFCFKSWPKIYLKADFELVRAFQIGDTIEKHSGNSYLHKLGEANDSISLFPAFRYMDEP